MHKTADRLCRKLSTLRLVGSQGLLSLAVPSVQMSAYPGLSLNRSKPKASLYDVTLLTRKWVSISLSMALKHLGKQMCLLLKDKMKVIGTRNWHEEHECQMGESKAVRKILARTSVGGDHLAANGWFTVKSDTGFASEWWGLFSIDFYLYMCVYLFVCVCAVLTGIRRGLQMPK